MAYINFKQSVPLPDVNSNVSDLAYRGMGVTQKNSKRKKLKIQLENILHEETTTRSRVVKHSN